MTRSCQIEIEIEIEISSEDCSDFAADFLTSPIYGGGARRVNILHRIFKSGPSWRLYCT